MVGQLIRQAGMILALSVATQAVGQSTSLPVPIPLDKESRQVSVVVDEGLKSMSRLPKSLKDARQAMFDGAQVEAEDLKRLADYKDTLAAAKYVEILMARGIENAPSDVAYYSSIAVGGGRVWVLPEMVQAMRLLDPKTEPKARISQYIKVLYPHAWAGNSLALEAVMEFNGEGRLFGPLSSATKAKIDAQLEMQEVGHFDLQRAVNILRKPNLTKEELGEARALLDRASQAEHLAVATTAANLLEQLSANQYGDAVQTN